MEAALNQFKLKNKIADTGSKIEKRESILIDTTGILF